MYCITTNDYSFAYTAIIIVYAILVFSLFIRAIFLFGREKGYIPASRCNEKLLFRLLAALFFPFYLPLKRTRKFFLGIF